MPRYNKHRLMAESDPRQNEDGCAVTAVVRPFDDEPDETLVDLLLEQSVSDRLRSLCDYVNAIARFRTV
jgi:hypothetical protein